MTDPTPHTEGTLIRWAAWYDRMVGLVALGREGRMRASTFTLAAIAPGERVLDIGCGTGTLLIAAASAHPDASYQGIDPAAEMIERARAKAARAGVEVRFEQGVAERLELADASVDVVLSSLMLHHLPPSTMERALAEAVRVLGPGGRLVVVDFPGAGPLFHRLGALLGRDHHGAKGHMQRVREIMGELELEGIDGGPTTPRYLHYLVGTKPS